MALFWGTLAFISLGGFASVRRWLRTTTNWAVGTSGWSVRPQIREVCVVYPAAEPGAEPTVQLTLTELTEEQRALYKALDLGRYRRV